MTRKVARDDPDENMGQDVKVRDGFGGISPGTRMVPCWFVWRLYKPKSETKPIQYVASKTKNHFGPKSPVKQGPKCSVTQDACFHDLHKIFFGHYMV